MYKADVPRLCFAFLMLSRSAWRLSTALPNCVSDVSTAAAAAATDASCIWLLHRFSWWCDRRLWFGAAAGHVSSGTCSKILACRYRCSELDHITLHPSTKLPFNVVRWYVSAASRSCTHSRNNVTFLKVLEHFGWMPPLMNYLLLLGRVALGAQRPIVIKLSRGRSVGRSVQCIVEKRRIGSGCRLAS